MSNEGKTQLVELIAHFRLDVELKLLMIYDCLVSSRIYSVKHN